MSPQPPRKPPGEDDALKRKEIEKVKSDKEFEKAKPEKEKLEHKEIEKIKSDKEFEKVKPEKEQPEKLKPEKEGKLEHKEIEKIKPDKEQIEKIKPEKEQIEKIKPEKEGKLEIKEIEKQVEKQVPEKLGKEIAEGGFPGGEVVNPAELITHAENLEATARQLRHFIARSARPDLSEGALRNEDDLPDEPTSGGDDA